MLNREDIFKANDLKKVKIEVPEWGGHIYVRNMSGHGRRIFQNNTISKDKVPEDFVELLIIATACDKDGNLIFTMDDLPELQKKSSAVLSRIFDAAADLNALTEKSIEKISGE